MLNKVQIFKLVFLKKKKSNESAIFLYFKQVICPCASNAIGHVTLLTRKYLIISFVTLNIE